MVTGVIQTNNVTRKEIIMPTYIEVEPQTTTIEKIREKSFIVFKTREIASFLKKVHDLIDNNDSVTAKVMIVEFLQSLAENIKK